MLCCVSGDRELTDFALFPDYRETAVKLQKEWNIEDPQKLPFAQHVNINALVRVTNRGLLYDESEREEKAQVCHTVKQQSWPP